MGGYGSGQWYRWGKRQTLDDLLCLDINKMIQRKAIEPHTQRIGGWSWRVVSTGEEISNIFYTSDLLEPHNMTLQLHYTTTATDTHHDYTISITRTPLHYGGHRYWFKCPYTGKRVTKLYLGAGLNKFASRHALKLPYASQSETKHSRALRKRERLQSKFSDRFCYNPVKPKGMHKTTYERLRAEYDRQDNICMGHLVDALGRLQGVVQT